MLIKMLPEETMISDSYHVNFMNFAVEYDSKTYEESSFWVTSHNTGYSHMFRPIESQVLCIELDQNIPSDFVQEVIVQFRKSTEFKIYNCPVWYRGKQIEVLREEAGN